MPTPVYVQSNGVTSSTGTSQSLAFTSNVTAGNLLIAHSIWRNSAGSPTISDTLGNSWTLIGENINGGAAWWEVLYACIANASGPCTVTIGTGTSNSQNLHIGEYQNGTITSDGFNTQLVGSGTSVSSGNITTTNSDDILLGFSGSNTPVSYGSGWTNRFAAADNDTFSDNIVTSTGTYAYTLTTVGPGGGLGTIWALKGTASAGITLTAQPATYVSATSETLHGTITGLGSAGNATATGFRYGTTTQYGNTVSNNGSFGTGPFSNTISGLTPGLIYHFQAFATDTNGTYYTSDYTFQAGANLPAFVQKASVDGAVSTGSRVVTMPGASTPGNAILVVLGQYPNTVSVSSVTDNAGNTYKVIEAIALSGAGEPTAYLWVGIAYNIATPASGNLAVTVAISGTTTNTHIDILEYANVASAGISPYFQLWGWNLNSNSITKPSITTVTNNELLIQTILTDGSPTITPGTNWTARANTVGVAGSFAVLEQIAAQPGLFQATASLSVSADWQNLLISLAPSGSFVTVPALTTKLLPPMGWDAWYTYGVGLTTAQIEANAAALVSTGLAAAGYVLVEPNGGGYQQNRDGSGNLVGSSGLPSMAAVSTYIQGLGLQMAAYTNIGPYGSGCSSFPTVSGYETIDAALWKTLNAQYLMIDSCYNADQTNTGGPPSNAVMQWYCDQIGLAIQATGQKIAVFNSPNQQIGWNSYLWAGATGAVGTADPNGIGDVGNPNYAVIIEVAAAQLPFVSLAGPGNWQQDYYLAVHNGFLSVAEGRTNMALWAILGWPLFISCDLTSIGAGDLQTLLNAEVIAVDQDALMIAGNRYSHIQLGSGNYIDVWARQLSGGRWAVALINQDTVSQTISATWSMFGQAGPFTARDVINHANLGQFNSGYSTTVASHDVAMLVLSPVSVGVPQMTLSFASPSISLSFTNSSKTLSVPDAAITLKVPS